MRKCVNRTTLGFGVHNGQVDICRGFMFGSTVCEQKCNVSNSRVELNLDSTTIRQNTQIFNVSQNRKVFLHHSRTFSSTNGLRATTQAPECLFQPLNFPMKTLLGPGPSNCPPRVLAASALPMLGHLHPEFTQVSHHSSLTLDNCWPKATTSYHCGSMEHFMSFCV